MMVIRPVERSDVSALMQLASKTDVSLHIGVFHGAELAGIKLAGTDHVQLILQFGCRQPEFPAQR